MCALPIVVAAAGRVCWAVCLGVGWWGGNRMCGIPVYFWRFFFFFFILVLPGLGSK